MCVCVWRGGGGVGGGLWVNWSAWDTQLFLECKSLKALPSPPVSCSHTQKHMRMHAHTGTHTHSRTQTHTHTQWPNNHTGKPYNSQHWVFTGERWLLRADLKMMLWKREREGRIDSSGITALHGRRHIDQKPWDEQMEDEGTEHPNMPSITEAQHGGGGRGRETCVYTASPIIHRCWDSKWWIAVSQSAKCTHSVWVQGLARDLICSLGTGFFMGPFVRPCIPVTVDCAYVGVCIYVAWMAKFVEMFVNVFFVKLFCMCTARWV